MIKLIFMISLTLLSFNSFAGYYKTGKLYNVNELINNVNKDIEDYCKRNLSEFNRNVRSDNTQYNKNNRFQLKTTLPSHSHSNQEKLNLEACFNVEKQKFNNIVNIYYNNKNDNEFLNCYEEVRDNRKKSISDNFITCLNENRKERCKHIVTSSASPKEKAIMYKKCLM